MARCYEQDIGVKPCPLTFCLHLGRNRHSTGTHVVPLLIPQPIGDEAERHDAPFGGSGQKSSLNLVGKSWVLHCNIKTCPRGSVSLRSLNFFCDDLFCP